MNVTPLPISKSMELLLQKFLRSFGKTADNDLEYLIQLLSSGLKPKLQKESEIIQQFEKMLKLPEQKQQLYNINRSLSLLQPQFKRKTNILYVFLELYKYKQQNDQNCVDFVDFHFQEIIVKKQINSENNSITPQNNMKYYIEQNQQTNNDLQLIAEKIPENQQLEIPNNFQFLQDLIYVIQGIDGKFIKYDINAYSASYQLIPKQSTFGLLKTQASFLNNVGDLGNNFIKLQQLLKNNFNDNQTNLFKKQFVQYVNDMLNEHYLKQLNVLQTMLQQNQLFQYLSKNQQIQNQNEQLLTLVYFVNFINEMLKPIVNFLLIVTEHIQQNQINNVNLLFQLEKYRLFNQMLYSKFQVYIQQLLKQQIKQFIFDNIYPQFFLILDQQQIKDQNQHNNQFNIDYNNIFIVDNQIIKDYSSNQQHYEEQLQIQQLKEIGKCTYYIQNVLRQFIDYQLFDIKQYQLLLDQLNDDKIFINQINFDPIKQFLYTQINNYLTNNLLLQQTVLLVKQLIFSFKSDFLTSFVQFNNEQTGDLHQLQCNSDLDMLINQSNVLQTGSFIVLDNNQRQVLKNNYLVQILPTKREILLNFKANELNIIFTNLTVNNFNRIFNLNYQLRKLELLLINNTDGFREVATAFLNDKANKSISKPIHKIFKKYQFQQFKLDQLTKIIANFIQLTLNEHYQQIGSAFEPENFQNQQTFSFINNLKFQLSRFNESIEWLLFDDKLLKFLFTLYEQTKMHCSQFDNLYSQLKDQKYASQAIQQQILNLMVRNQQELTRSLSEFMREARQKRTEQVDGLLERLQAVC